MDNEIMKLIEGGKADTFDLVMLANFVHQVVNPLNGVAGTLENLADGLIKEERRKEQRLRASRAQIEQCIALLRNLAYLTQGFNRLSAEDTKTVILPELVIESAMYFQEDGKSKKIEINLVDRDTQNTVLGHHELLRQVLMNIFDNCVKYSEPGYNVEVNQWIQKATSNAMISIQSRPKYPIEISDLAKIFELGYRGSNAKKMIASGTGLGLYICKRIVEEVHGGTLYVQASGKTDVEFVVKLPNGQIGRAMKDSHG